MVWFRRLHKWIGFAIGLQVALWMLSGLMMGLLDHERVQGSHHRAITTDEPLHSPSRRLMEPAELLKQLPPNDRAGNVRLRSFLDKPVYHLDTSDGPRLYDAVSGKRVIVTKDIAAHLSRRDYSGPGSIVNISAVQAPSMEVRRHTGDTWRVDFDDDDDTSLYVSVGDGAILERRNATWRLFDVFWMLLIMDYWGREDFNNALVISASLIAAWFSVTGIVLFFESFRREDFLSLLPDAWWRQPARIAVCAPHGEVITRIDSFADGRLYDELAKENIVLPSNCGGGGTCGLCIVSLGPELPESPADRRLIPAQQRASGVRLACQAKVAKHMVVGISDTVLAADTIRAEVIGSRLLTPYIREIRLRLDDKPFAYRAGSYVHAIIPPYRLDPSVLAISEEARAGWRERGLPVVIKNAEERRRAYSLATASSDDPGTIILNVRFFPPPAGSRGTPAGVGSTYIWSLKPGDQLTIVGPLGDFHAQNTERRMVFIGGGAGMAPLRSIIRDELIHKSTDRQIDFWYGARRKSDLFYVEEFDRLQHEHSNFSWQAVLSEALTTDNWNGPSGFVHRTVEKEIRHGTLELRSCEFYVCGPPPMLAATREMLADFGVLESEILFDDFGI